MKSSVMVADMGGSSGVVQGIPLRSQQIAGNLLGLYFVLDVSSLVSGQRSCHFHAHVL